MERNENIDYCIRYLMEQEGVESEIPVSLKEKQLMLRALMNVWEPQPLSDKYTLAGRYHTSESRRHCQRCQQPRPRMLASAPLMHRQCNPFCRRATAETRVRQHIARQRTGHRKSHYHRWLQPALPICHPYGRSHRPQRHPHP